MRSLLRRGAGGRRPPTREIPARCCARGADPPPRWPQGGVGKGEGRGGGRGSGVGGGLPGAGAAQRGVSGLAARPASMRRSWTHVGFAARRRGARAAALPGRPAPRRRLASRAPPHGLTPAAWDLTSLGPARAHAGTAPRGVAARCAIARVARPFDAPRGRVAGAFCAPRGVARSALWRTPLPPLPPLTPPFSARAAEEAASSRWDLQPGGWNEIGSWGRVEAQRARCGRRRNGKKRPR